MIFEQIVTGGCQSYLIGCPEGCVAALIDPEIRQIDRYLGTLQRDGLRLRYVIDTHTHADHFSAAHEIAKRLGVPVVTHRDSPAPYADLRLQDGDMLVVGSMQAAGYPHAGPHARFDVPAHERPSVHGRHAADRRDGAHGPSDRRSRGALRQPIRRDPQARPRAQGLSGARLQTAQLEHDSGRAREQSAPAEARSGGVRRHDAASQSHGADAPHRGVAHQHDGRENRRAAARRGGCEDAVHVARRARRSRRARPRHRRCSMCASATRTPRAMCRARVTCRAASSSFASTTSFRTRRRAS